MNILLTNDDGIYADGLLALFREIRTMGTVVVVAPDSQRSSVGHGITLENPIAVRKIKTKTGVSGIGISGTPADCVKFALKKVLKVKPDIVVSGINLGPNDGCSVFYSGTVAAAREASLHGIPAIAFSLDTFVKPDFRYGAKFAKKIIKCVLANGLPKETFLSVNIPHLPESKIKGVKITRQGKAPILTRFIKICGGKKSLSFLMSGDTPKREKNHQIDTVALSQGYVTVTPLQNDLTNYCALKDLKKWCL
jgi:5'-nucleotidase